MVHPAWCEPAPPWRHALFVLVNATACAGLLRYRRDMFRAYALLAAQQVLTHGVYGARVWREQGRVDWASVGVLVFMPVLLVILKKKRGQAPS